MTVFLNPLAPALLSETSEIVTEFDGQIAELADTLFELMQAHGGVGLAASAIGRSEPLLVIDLPDASGDRIPMALVNPRITAVHDGTTDQADLFSGSTSQMRFRRIDVTYETLEGETVTLVADGPLAIGLQDQISRMTGSQAATAPRRLH
ncbi:peptide deformylase [Primorskyibacter sp. 2E107]|uniref:peptide deformylase n=1 Tax=Primorskyibacter sp. 2E107 TaxID=3403458 RepID=UPI003AF51A4F